jgi:hypothetical protein
VAHPRCSLPRCDVEGERDDARRHSEALRVLVGRVLDEVRPGDGGLGRPVSSWTAVREAFPSRGPRNRVPHSAPGRAESAHRGTTAWASYLFVIFWSKVWLRFPLGNSAGSLTVSSSTYWHRFSEHRYT